MIGVLTSEQHIRLARRECLRIELLPVAVHLCVYIDGFSKDVSDIFDKFKFAETIADLNDKGLLFQLVSLFAGLDLGPDAVDDLQMGTVYEELIRRFSEMSNETAGEHFSPRDGLKLAVDLLISGSEDDLSKPGSIVIANRASSRIASLTPYAVKPSFSCCTVPLVGSSTQSRRRNTVKGRIISPYFDCL